MANFLGNLGAAFRGQQQYQTWQDQTDAAKVRLDADKERLSELKDLTAQAKKQREQQPTIDQATLDYLAGAGQGIPPPPGQPPGPMPNGAQAPAPGQQSVPMQQPTMAYPQQRQMGPGVPPGGGMPQQGPQGPPQQPQIPPYQTVGGAPRPSQGPQGIPPPPQQRPDVPPPNSMSLQDAAQFIKARGITDPAAGLQILEKLSPYLNNQAKMEAAQLKQQLDQQNKVSALQEKYDALKTASEDRRYSVDERKEAQAAANDTRRMIGTVMAGIAQQRETRQAQSLQQKAAANSLDKDDLRFMAEQYWAGDKTVLSGLARNQQALSAARHAIVEYGKENGKNGADLAQATAEFEGLKAGERALGTRSANVGLAVNEANLLSDLALKTSNEWSRSGIASLNELQALATKKGASPELRRFVAANNSFINAYSRAISPSGAPAQKEKDHARDVINEGFSKGDYAATIDILKQEMQAAKQAPQATKEELRQLAKAGNPGAKATMQTFSSKEELQAAIKSGKIKKGDTFNDPSGNPHTVN